MKSDGMTADGCGEVAQGEVGNRKSEITNGWILRTTTHVCALVNIGFSGGEGGGHQRQAFHLLSPELLLWSLERAARDNDHLTQSRPTRIPAAE